MTSIYLITINDKRKVFTSKRKALKFFEHQIMYSMINSKKPSFRKTSIDEESQVVTVGDWCIKFETLPITK